MEVDRLNILIAFSYILQLAYPDLTKPGVIIGYKLLLMEDIIDLPAHHSRLKVISSALNKNSILHSFRNTSLEPIIDE